MSSPQPRRFCVDVCTGNTTVRAEPPRLEQQRPPVRHNKQISSRLDHLILNSFLRKSGEGLAAQMLVSFF